MPEEIARYRTGSLESVEATLAVEDHLDSCAACRDALRATASGATISLARKLAPVAGDFDCPDERLLRRYANGRADAAEREIVETHIEDCPRCAQELNVLRPERSRPRFPSLRRALIPAALGMATAVAALALFGFWTRVHQEQRQNAALRAQIAGAQARMAHQRQEQERRLAQEKASHAHLIAQTRQETHRAQQDLGKARAENATLRKRLAAARSDAAKDLEAMLLGRSQSRNVAMLLAALSTGTVRGGGDPVRRDITLIDPVATLVLPTRPILRWNPLVGAARYHVLVTNVDDPGDTQQETVAGTRWRPIRALRRGAVYEWQVTADRAGKSGGSPRARFRVLDAEEAGRLARAKREYAGLPLTLGFLYAQAGLLDDAEREIEVVLKANPNHSVAQNLLSDLRKRRQGVP